MVLVNPDRHIIYVEPAIPTSNNTINSEITLYSLPITKLMIKVENFNA